MKLITLTPASKQSTVSEILKKISTFPKRNGIEADADEVLRSVAKQIYHPTPTMFVLAALRDGEPIGHVLVEIHKRYGIRTLFVWQIEKYDKEDGLSEEFRKTVIEKIKYTAKRFGIKTISASAGCDSRAKYFIDKFGFKKTGVDIELRC